MLWHIISCSKYHRLCHVGLYLKKHWAEQSRYESSGRPYVSFNALLEGDPYLESVTPTAEEQGQRIGPTLKLHMSKMLEVGWSSGRAGQGLGCDAGYRRVDLVFSGCDAHKV